ncbi:MAG: hypothetical protein U1F66_04480 [bacterium]
MKIFRHIPILMTLCTLLACSGAGGGNVGGGGGGGGANDCGGFGGSVADNAGVTYSCVDPAGALYEMKFDGQGGFVWYFITTGDAPVPNGQYSVVGDQIRIVIPGFDVGGADFDETSTQTVVKLGMLAGFRTPRLSCGAFRHDFDAGALAVADYRCQPYSPGPSVTHHPVFRLAGVDATQNSPLFNQSQPGNAFWSTQKDIAGSISNEDYNGIYRQIGNHVCMYFPGAPAGKQEVEADLGANLDTLTVDRPELNQSGSCGRI